MRYVYMVTDGAGCWPMLRDEPDAPLWADGHPAVEVDLLGAFPDEAAERLFYDLAELAFDRETGTASRSRIAGRAKPRGIAIA